MSGIRFASLFVSVFATFVMIASAGVVSAQSAEELVGIQTLDNAMEHTNCRVDFTTNMFNFLLQASPESFSDLSSYVDRMKLDQSNLQNYDTAGNVAGFRSYMKDIYDPDFSEMNNLAALEIGNPNLSSKLLDAIRSKQRELLAVHEKCAFSALNNYAGQKSNAYDQIVNGYQLQMFSLNARGIDIGPLVSLLKDANDQVVEPLSNVENTVNPNVNASRVLRLALNKYCLFDGCVNGVNLHLAASFEETKLQLLLNYMKGKPLYSGASTAFGEAQASLNRAKADLTYVGKQSYNSTDQGDEIWDNLFSASKSLKDVVNRYGE